MGSGSASTGEPVKDRGTWAPLVLFIAFPVVLLTMILITVETTTGPAETRPADAIATGETGDRHVAMVVYETDTFPHIDFFRMGSIGYSVQAEAFDLDTGERLWDTMLSNDYPSIGAEPLAVGGDLAYVRTDEGLVILDAQTGRILFRDEGIPGLGDDYVASRTAYAWDAETRHIVLLDAQGAVRSIPVGEDTARPAAAGVAERWRDELRATTSDTQFSYYASSGNATRDRAKLPGPEPTPDPLTGIVPDDNMLFASWSPDTAWTSSIVIDEAQYAVGAEFGFAVSESHDGSGYTLQVADLDTRTAQAQLETDGGAGIRSVAVDPHGYVVLVMPDSEQQSLLVVATADSLHASVIGERGWLGS